MYFAGMNQVRTTLASTPYFSVTGTEHTSSGSVLPKLTKQGNLVAGALTRVVVGALLNPFTVLKARYEVPLFPTLATIPVLTSYLRHSQSKLYAYHSIPSAIGSLIRAGPSELFRGVLATSLRDAPYAGLFMLSYEQLKTELCMSFKYRFPLEQAHVCASSFLAILAKPISSAQSGLVHGLSAAAAGALATLATHPLDVVKVCSNSTL